jgi:hypothetical protein
MSGKENPFAFSARLADDTLVLVAAAFDHEGTLYLEHAWLARQDGTGGPDFLDIVSWEARLDLLQQAEVEARRLGILG